jgi:predicted N-acetyltransferase YhbS
VLVAERAGRIVGLVTLHMVPVLHDPGDWCRLTSLVVRPSARRGGVARALVAEAESLARAAGWGYGRVSEHFLKPLVEAGA